MTTSNYLVVSPSCIMCHVIAVYNFVTYDVKRQTLWYTRYFLTTSSLLHHYYSYTRDLMYECTMTLCKSDVDNCPRTDDLQPAILDIRLTQHKFLKLNILEFFFFSFQKYLFLTYCWALSRNKNAKINGRKESNVE